MEQSGKDEPASQRRRDAPFRRAPHGHPILLLGAGIAGATAAHALAERGHSVTVLDAHAVAHGASGNEAAVLFPQLTKRWTPAAAWHFAAYSFMLHQLQRWQFPHSPCGMVRLPRHAADEEHLRTLTATLGLDRSIAHWVERDEASERAGLPLPTGGAWFPRGTWLSPHALCTHLLQHPNITLHTHTPVTALTREGGRWCATTPHGRFEATHCILATAADTAAFAPSLKLNQVGGQVSLYAARDTAAPLKTILCYKGYVIPAGERVLIGATYDHHDTTRDVTTAKHAANRADVEAFLPGWLRGDPIGGRTSIRATTPDRLPYVGMLEEGLWVTAGHGSRGMLSAPLAAEILASGISGECAPVTAQLVHAVRVTR